jgi:hypothetical protein
MFPLGWFCCSPRCTDCHSSHQEQPDARFDWLALQPTQPSCSWRLWPVPNCHRPHALRPSALAGRFLALLRYRKRQERALITSRCFVRTSHSPVEPRRATQLQRLLRTTFLLSLYLQLVTGLSPSMAGLVLIAMPVIQAFVSPAAGRLSDRFEPRVLASSGMAFTAIGLFLMSRFDAGSSLPTIVVALALLGLGIGVFSSPNTNAVMTSVEPTRYGLASATLSTMRQVGMELSMGIATLFISMKVGTADTWTHRLHCSWTRCNPLSSSVPWRVSWASFPRSFEARCTMPPPKSPRRGACDGRDEKTVTVDNGDVPERDRVCYIVVVA